MFAPATLFIYLGLALLIIFGVLVVGALILFVLIGIGVIAQQTVLGQLSRLNQARFEFVFYITVILISIGITIAAGFAANVLFNLGFSAASLWVSGATIGIVNAVVFVVLVKILVRGLITYWRQR